MDGILAFYKVVTLSVKVEVAYFACPPFYLAIYVVVAALLNCTIRILKRPTVFGLNRRGILLVITKSYPHCYDKKGVTE